MWIVKKNYPKNEEDTICPICRKEEDTIEHVLDCEVELEKGKNTIGSSNINHWEQIPNTFRENLNKTVCNFQSMKKK